MITIQEYQQLVQEVADLERKEAESEGALTQMTEQLKEDTGCTSAKAALALQKKLAAEIETLNSEINEAYAAYQTAYSELTRS